MVILRKKSKWINLLVLYHKVKMTKFVVLKDLPIVLNSHLDLGISKSMKS